MAATREIFVCHSSADEVVAGEICRELESRGFSCWIAPRNAEPGLEYAQALTAAITNASIFLLLLSANADRSRHVRRELEIADRRGIPIVSVRIEERNLFENLDYFVANQQWCNLVARPVEDHLGDLEEVLRRRLGNPATERLWRELGGPLADRYALPAPRALLSIDGGGIRGLISLEILARIERLLAARRSDPSSFRLSDYFDFIAGSGSGGLFAIALAQGRSVRELLEFFATNAAEMFGKAVRPFGSMFLPNVVAPSPRLAAAMHDFIGQEGTLSPESLRCLTMIVVRNHDYHSAWPLTNNPLAKYNDLRRVDSWRRFQLLPLARACMLWSPRAHPEIMEIPNTSRTVRLSDGTFTPYANPAFLLYEAATSKPYGLEWRRGERNLLLVSIGTGRLPVLPSGQAGAGNIEDLLIPFMNATVFDQDLKCRTVGRCIHGPPIDRQIGDLIAREADGRIIAPSKDTGREFTYVRYEYELSPDGLSSLGVLAPPSCDPELILDLESEHDIERLREVGRSVASTVGEDHFTAVPASAAAALSSGSSRG